MRAGLLRHRIKLQSRRRTRDAVGGDVLSWFTEATVPAQVQPLQGREYTAAQQTQSEVEVRFVIRYFRRLQADWQLVWENQRYEIVSIIDVNGLHEEVQLMAKSVKTVEQ
jgi:SPP1 family predicted phage head-tail adaptor